MDEGTSILFEVPTPLGFTVRTSQRYWQGIVAKHPDLTDRLEEVKQALISPMEVHRSSRDAGVLLFYAENEHWVVAVVRRLNGDGFLVTAYRTDSIKEGEIIWPK
ncbi:MAG: hypothetical protein A3F84_24500 [Candidatus Handelsmanbacteria bacterium RIFCSPLOWO2_12_FULL_64_10]|uniref:DUF4258 domain-containing protein n=1 Tax=Handelsmanbacteria sp. (strain RIFCSPLOWO2_12_FULL_64_10) TaxID=1817868 RepID=A0A1F6CMH2_HANXR|nr:MAG: hypothetical protein A3F84_24500 [Candidatus Handelsmanbacteria bacterium RIFCSPLOWO2_12_FULL_64_10]